LYFNCEKWEELWVVSHMQQVDLLIPHKDIFESSVFLTQAPLDWMCPLSIVKQKYLPNMWLWSSYAHATLLFLIWQTFLSIRGIHGHFKCWFTYGSDLWTLEGWLNLSWSCRAL